MANYERQPQTYPGSRYWLDAANKKIFKSSPVVSEPQLTLGKDGRPCYTQPASPKQIGRALERCHKTNNREEVPRMKIRHERRKNNQEMRSKATSAIFVEGEVLVD